MRARGGCLVWAGLFGLFDGQELRCWVTLDLGCRGAW
jgi:hypothetical protein